jgi:transcriptional regulator with XRE-family HTH domain
MTFGEYIKERRRKLNLTLRAFCETNGYDPGNHSRLERGELNPPEDNQKMKDLAKALSIRHGSGDWSEFHSLAHVARGQIPKVLLSDAEVVAKLPVLLRTLEGEPLAPQKMDELIDFIRSRQ